MRRNRIIAAAFLAAASISPFPAFAGTLRGSTSSMEQQHEVAVQEDLTFAEKAAQVQSLVDSGELVAVSGNADYALSGVSFPYARPEIVLFIERLSAQFHSANGSRLVVTSLTRPEEVQPRNAHKLSVHPAGMAVDFRVPSSAEARSWLESALLGLENAGVLDVTRERYPPHYHVAVFPAEYKAYAAKRAAAEAAPVIQVEESPSVVKAVVATALVPAPATEHNGSLVVALAMTLLLAAAGIVTASRSFPRRVGDRNKTPAGFDEA